MKKLKLVVIGAMILIAANQSVNAQAKTTTTHVETVAKTAHVEVNEIISKMPAMIEAQKQLQQIGKTYEDTFKTMTDEYQTKLKKYDSEASTVTDKVNEERAKEVQDMQKRISDFRENAQKELQTKEADITKPIIEKVKASIQKVAKAKGYQYVFNSEGLLVADGPNLTADVKKDLGF